MPSFHPPGASLDQRSAHAAMASEHFLEGMVRVNVAAEGCIDESLVQLPPVLAPPTLSRFFQIHRSVKQKP